MAGVHRVIAFTGVDHGRHGKKRNLWLSLVSVNWWPARTIQRPAVHTNQGQPQVALFPWRRDRRRVKAMTRVNAGHGYDEIIGGAAFNTLYGGEGNDVIDAGTGPTDVHGARGDDTITWAYAPLTGSGLTLYGTLMKTPSTDGERQLNTITLERDATDSEQSKAVRS